MPDTTLDDTDTLRIALDMDGTLADAIDTVFQHMGVDATQDDVTSWDWPVEQFGADAFLDAFDYTWANKWQDIAPAENRLYNTVRELVTDFHVDIVTAQPNHDGVTNGKRQWLDQHSIPYNEIVPVPRDKTKADLDYDVFIDDKPHLPARVNAKQPDATVLVRDRPHNRNAAGEYVRVQMVADALTFLVGNESRYAEPDARTMPVATPR